MPVPASHLTGPWRQSDLSLLFIPLRWGSLRTLTSLVQSGKKVGSEEDRGEGGCKSLLENVVLIQHLPAHSFFLPSFFLDFCLRQALVL